MMASSARFFALLGLVLGATDAIPSPVALLNPRNFADQNLSPIAKRLGGNVALRLMPLGDALTHGSGESNSYRLALRELLMTDGNPVDMVGSQKAGDMDDNDVEGWPGLTVAELSEKAKAAVPEYLPNMVLINAGAADCEGDSKDVSGVKATMLEILQFTWKNSLKSSIVLSTVPPSGNADTDNCIEDVNAQYRTLVQEQQRISKKVVIVDFHSDEGLSLEEVGDDGLPTEDGYKHMAEMWLAGIKDAASRGWVEKPEDDPTPAPSPTDKPGQSAPTSREKVRETSSAGEEDDLTGGDSSSDSSSDSSPKDDQSDSSTASQNLPSGGSDKPGSSARISASGLIAAVVAGLAMLLV